MIVPMKCLTLMCLTEDREHVLSHLQKLGVVHVTLETRPDNEHIVFKQRALQDLERAQNALALAKKNHPSTYDLPAFKPKQFLSAVVNELDHLNALRVRYENLQKDVKNLEPWGDFSMQTLREFSEKGVHVYLCSAPMDRMLAFSERDDLTVEVIKKEKNQVYFAVISLEALPLDTLPIMQLPDMETLSETQSLLIDTETKMMQVNFQLATLAKQMDLLVPLKAKFEDELAYLMNTAGMSKEGDRFVWLKGYVPEPHTEDLKKFALENGCALILRDPTEDDNPPTQLQNNTFVSIIKPLFGFIGITPGYREWDVSSCMLVFFTIFVAMITNDAGYGTVFLVGSLLGWYAVRKNREMWPLMGFLTLESVACVAWGVMAGSFFGMSAATLETIGLGFMVELSKLPATHIPWLEDAYAGKDLAGSRLLNIEYFCFVLAFIHLAFARLWKARLAIKQHHICQMLGHIGWAVILFANLFVAVNFVVAPGSMPAWVPYLYVAGIPLVLLDVNFKDVSAIFQTPLSLINSFVDTLSYIRLYAVGLAGACIAENFNSILGGLATSPVMTIISGGVLAGGHVLNILLVLMAIMVHAIRLNALEFSNHMGLEWAGYPYQPFEKKSKS